MRIQTILNRVEKFKSFVYGEAKFGFTIGDGEPSSPGRVIVGFEREATVALSGLGALETVHDSPGFHPKLSTAAPSGL